MKLSGWQRPEGLPIYIPGRDNKWDISAFVDGARGAAGNLQQNIRKRNPGLDSVPIDGSDFNGSYDISFRGHVFSIVRKELATFCRTAAVPLLIYHTSGSE
ncbi:MAG: hypothetical protein IPI42_06555 [Saprospiraceae bacterium]|nr:hypothetical protein [Candidatus Parvibacillus calidus]